MSNFIKILSLFNTQPNRSMASPAIFKHVRQVPYSRGFKFGEKGPIKIFKHVGQVSYSIGFKFGEKGLIKILPHFCLQVRRCRISSKF